MATKKPKPSSCVIFDLTRPRPVLPALMPDSNLSDFSIFAVLNQPQIEAAYFDWVASAERITQERSLPDPRLTFQTDIQNVLRSVMPGLMPELSGPGKRELLLAGISRLIPGQPPAHGPIRNSPAASLQNPKPNL